MKWVVVIYDDHEQDQISETAVFDSAHDAEEYGRNWGAEWDIFHAHTFIDDVCPCGTRIYRATRVPA